MYRGFDDVVPPRSILFFNLYIDLLFATDANSWDDQRIGRRSLLHPALIWFRIYCNISLIIIMFVVLFTKKRNKKTNISRNPLPLINRRLSRILFCMRRNAMRIFVANSIHLTCFIRHNIYILIHSAIAIHTSTMNFHVSLPRTITFVTYFLSHIYIYIIENNQI